MKVDCHIQTLDAYQTLVKESATSIEDKIGSKIQRLSKQDLSSHEIKKIAAYSITVIFLFAAGVLGYAAIASSPVFFIGYTACSLTATLGISVILDLHPLKDLEKQKTREWCAKELDGKSFNTIAQFLDKNMIKHHKVIEYKLLGDASPEKYAAFDVFSKELQSIQARSLHGFNRQSRSEFSTSVTEALSNNFDQIIIKTKKTEE